MSHAADRLDASRARLLARMQGFRSGQREGGAAGQVEGASFLDLLNDIPLIGGIAQGLRAAWRGSPLPAAAQLAEDAGNEALRPTAEQHPLALVGIAMAGGALLYWARPWRTLWRSALFAGVTSQLAARLVSQIPLASLFDAIQTLVARSPVAARRQASTEPNPEGLRHSG